MKAVLCVRHAPPEALEIVDLPDPVAGPGEVVVEVAAVGLNFFDTLIIRNLYQQKPDLPFSPGGEFAGRVLALGPGVTGPKVGTRVCGNVGYGAARERLVVRADRLAVVPDDLDLVRAAGLIITYGTSLYALRDRGELKAGETLVVLGAAGGVGLAAVELGKILGARVIACASSPDKIAFARSHGADIGIDYTTENLKLRLKELTGGEGADVVYDPVGGDLSEQALRSLGWCGRLLVIGFAAGEIPKLPLNLLLLKNCDARGVAFGTQAMRDPAWLTATITELMGYARSGAISAHVDATFPLERCAEALGEIAGRKVKGKVVLTTGL
ncbi:putative alcohol dehydrogenase [Azorhizobium caulinodans ORS 571]|uniref:Putative alcohol dehydrogenase n=1 Tax=Azorhizobium caulinodans (strain ATCC 43989 / DSM 5975 / JCM 20966 / LMG 6465 / NBRC 14845 / NCIMB 13405 / ORS 571) TaxID=438753 RepID=A8IQ79_AZOC5|nr:NADPH:quinone oxidoreductase family protein [Azorhizobium caulinodans]BAF86752.1 putative alcohol dehydrogenase [Azorhizobium caulinodans ORS 571]